MLSPLVWAVLTGLLCEELQAELQLHMNSHPGFAGPEPVCTFYADDKHLGWEGTSVAQMEGALKQLDIVTSLIAKFGLALNREKSQCMLSVQGQGSAAFSRKWVTMSSCLSAPSI